MPEQQSTPEERAARLRALEDQRAYEERAHDAVAWPDPRRAGWMLRDRLALLDAEIARLREDTPDPCGAGG